MNAEGNNSQTLADAQHMLRMQQEQASAEHMAKFQQQQEETARKLEAQNKEHAMMVREMHEKADNEARKHAQVRRELFEQRKSTAENEKLLIQRARQDCQDQKAIKDSELSKDKQIQILKEAKAKGDFEKSEAEQVARLRQAQTESELELMRSKYAQFVSEGVNSHEALLTPIRTGDHTRGAWQDTTYDTGLEEAEWVTPDSYERSIHGRDAAKAEDQQFMDSNLGNLQDQLDKQQYDKLRLQSIMEQQNEQMIELQVQREALRAQMFVIFQDTEGRFFVCGWDRYIG